MTTPVVGQLGNYRGPGVYRHFKGKLYYVLGLTRECEDNEELFVLYRPMYILTDEWPGFIHRRLAVWNEVVSYQGGNVPRFRLLTKVP